MNKQKDSKELPKDPFKTIIADRDNLNREYYQNLTWIGSSETIVPQSETVTSDILTFFVPKCPPGDYYDLTSMRMQSELFLQDKDGKKPADDSVVGPINYFCQTMIKSVEVFVNGTQVVTSSPSYAQKAIIDALLNHNRDDRASILTNQGFAMDKPEVLRETPSWDTHKALNKRAQFFSEWTKKEGQAILKFNDKGTTFQIPLLTDINNIETPLLSKVDLKIVVTFHRPTYYLWTDEAGKDKGYKLKVVSSMLRIKQLRATDGYTRTIEDQIEKHPFKYRFKRIETILDTLNTSSANFHRSFDMTTNLPERILVLIQEEELLNPSYVQNPINWNSAFACATANEKAELIECELTVNGIPLTRLKGKDYFSFAALHYQELMEQTGNDKFGCGFNRHNFGMGSYMISFDLTRSNRCATSGNVRQPVKEGQALLSIKFKNGATKPLAILIVQEFNSSFTVDKNRKVLFNYID